MTESMDTESENKLLINKLYIEFAISLGEKTINLSKTQYKRYITSNYIRTKKA